MIAGPAAHDAHENAGREPQKEASGAQHSMKALLTSLGMLFIMAWLVLWLAVKITFGATQAAQA
jgi:hypothetical protein